MASIRSAMTWMTPLLVLHPAGDDERRLQVDDQPALLEQPGPDDRVGVAGLVLERDEAESLGRPGPLPGDDAARRPAPARPAGARAAPPPAHPRQLGPRISAIGWRPVVSPSVRVVRLQPLQVGHPLERRERRLLPGLGASRNSSSPASAASTRQSAARRCAGEGVQGARPRERPAAPPRSQSVRRRKSSTEAKGRSPPAASSPLDRRRAQPRTEQQPEPDRRGRRSTAAFRRRRAAMHGGQHPHAVAPRVLHQRRRGVEPHRLVVEQGGVERRRPVRLAARRWRRRSGRS